MASVKDIIDNSLNIIKEMLEAGKADKDIAKRLDISYASYKNYKSKSVAVKAIYDEVKNTRNEEVENSLFKLCNGFTYHEEVATKVKEEYEGSQGQTLIKESVKVTKVRKYSKPDLNAQKYWLNNKKKASWKEDPHKVSNDKENLKLKKKEIDNKSFGID
ncbi:MAG: Xaa-His dipeptidase [Clostridium sp.]